MQKPNFNCALTKTLGVELGFFRIAYVTLKRDLLSMKSQLLSLSDSLRSFACHCLEKVNCASRLLLLVMKSW